LHAADGTLYVGSLATGEVVAFDDGAPGPRTVIAAGPRGVTGVHVHGETLWTCSVDTSFMTPTELRSYALDGTPTGSYPLAAQYFCNDVAFDAAGNLYAADSFSGTVQRLAAGGSVVETFVQDPRFFPATQGAFGLDGIAIDGGTLYVNKLDSSQLFAIEIASKAITEITVTPRLAAPDGMRVLDPHTLVVVEGGEGRLSRVEISGATATATPLSSDLDMPTSVVVARGSAWVTEGQLGRLFGGQAPNTPFAVRRVAL
jgi:outer membrane protein assembly factor BamB